MDERTFVWLLFSQHTDGLVSLRAICTTESEAERRRKALQTGWETFEIGNEVVRAWVEKAETNHLVMEGMFEVSTYGGKIHWPAKTVVIVR